MSGYAIKSFLGAMLGFHLIVAYFYGLGWVGYRLWLLLANVGQSCP